MDTESPSTKGSAGSTPSPKLAAADVLRQLAQDPCSLMNPRVAPAFMCNDVIGCVRRYVAAPRLITLSFSRPPTAIGMYTLSVFDMGADIEAQKWTEYPIEFDGPLPASCDITLHKPHALAVITSGVPLIQSKPTSRPTNSFTWSLDNKARIFNLPHQETRRSEVKALTIYDHIVVYGGAEELVTSCDILRDDMCKNIKFPNMPPPHTHIAAKLPSQAAVMLFGIDGSTWKLDFNQLRASKHRRHDEFLTKCHYGSATALDANAADIYIWQPYRMAGYGLPNGSIWHFDCRTEQSTPLASFPLQMCRRFHSTTVAIDSNCIAVLGQSVDIGLPARNSTFLYGCMPTRQPDCWLYDVRANRWRREPRWATGANMSAAMIM